MSEDTRNYGLEIKEAEGDVAKQRDLIQEFVTNVMVKGVDYGEIPGIPTPTLLKGGAEKLIALFGGVRRTSVLHREFDRDAEFTLKTKYGDKEITGFVSFEVKCEIVDRSGNLLGSGLGAANSFEKKFAAQGDGYATQNSLLKMAEKRSMVDAALTLSMVSGMYTQDVEDMDLSKDDDAPRQKSSYTPAATPAAGTVSEDDDDWIVEFGQDQYKGKRLSSLPPASIKFYHGAVKKNIKEEKFVEKNKKILAKIEKVASELGVAI